MGRGGGVEAFSALVVALTLVYVATLPGDYEINTMAPVLNAPREKVFKYLADPRNFANLAPEELQPVRVLIETEESSRLSGNCTRESRVDFTLRLPVLSVPLSAVLSETFACAASSVAWVEYRGRVAPFASHRTTYFLEELVSVDGKAQTEVHERTIVRTSLVWRLVSAHAHMQLHALVLANLKNAMECQRT